MTNHISWPITTKTNHNQSDWSYQSLVSGKTPCWYLDTTVTSTPWSPRRSVTTWPWPWSPTCTTWRTTPVSATTSAWTASWPRAPGTGLQCLMTMFSCLRTPEPTDQEAGAVLGATLPPPTLPVSTLDQVRPVWRSCHPWLQPVSPTNHPWGHSTPDQAGENKTIIIYI